MKVAIIIPCYNESDRLDANKCTEYLLQNAHVHFYFIDDGSTDNTISIINGEFQINPNLLGTIMVYREVDYAIYEVL